MIAEGGGGRNLAGDESFQSPEGAVGEMPGILFSLFLSGHGAAERREDRARASVRLLMGVGIALGNAVDRIKGRKEGLDHLGIELGSRVLPKILEDL